MNRKSRLIISMLIGTAMFAFCAAGAYAEEETEETEAEETLDPITPSDYLIENIGDYMTAEDLNGLPVTQYIYEITDEDVSEEANDELGAYEEEEEVDRGAQTGDIVYVTVTDTVSGTDEEETDETYFYIGDEEYGPEFDEQLTGAKAGDTLTFDITFSDEDADDLMIDEDWAGETVSFVVEVESVCELVEPEYTDEYVAENTEYDSIEDYEAALREYMEEEFEEISYMDAYTELMDEALARCTFTGIPEDLSEACRAETLESYAMFVGTDDEEEILDLFGMTEEDLDEEVEDLAQRRLLISWICEENDVEVTEEDYDTYVEDYALYYGYDSAREFEDDMDRSYLVWSLYESMASDILYDEADITEETSTLDEYYDWDWDDEGLDDEEWDDEWDDEWEYEDESESEDMA